MISRRLHKKIYYIPGMITLILGPLIFMIRTQNYLTAKTQYCISIVMSNNDKNDYSESLHPKRIYTKLNITGNPLEDSLTFLLLENFARGINLSKNDSVGIKVILSNNIKYKSFIYTLNACLKSGINEWIPWGDTIFIYHRKYNKQDGEQFCQNSGFKTFWGYDVIIKEPPKPPITLLQKIAKEKETIKLAIPFIILIVIMGFISIKRNINEG